jgi:DNA-binding LytR/AlgR family response regulator
MYEKIDHIEAYAAYSKIYDGKMVTLVNEPLSNLDEILPNKLFMRVHKSHIINTHKVTGYDHKFLFLGDVKVPIGISYKPKLEGLFRLYDITN